MSTQHTPGPWWVSAAKDCVWHADHGRICTPPNHAQVWNWESNAHLIAAAPDMYEALTAAIECGMVPKSSVADGGASALARQVVVADMIRAARAKAEGKS